MAHWLMEKLSQDTRWSLARFRDAYYDNTHTHICIKRYNIPFTVKFKFSSSKIVEFLNQSHFQDSKFH